MENIEQLESIYKQLEALFNSLGSKFCYRRELIDDYHNMVTRLEIQFSTLHEWKDFIIPSTAQLPISQFDMLVTYDGDIVRAKIQQLISVVEKLIADNRRDKNTPPITTNEISFWDIREFKTLIIKVRKIVTLPKVLLETIENNLGIKILVLAGGVFAGIGAIYWVIQRILFK